MKSSRSIRRSVCATLFLLLVSIPAMAEQDFYGIQMRSEVWARALVLNQDNPDYSDLYEGPILDQSVRAEASLKEAPDGHIDFRVTVFNDSGAAISADYRFRDFFVHMRDGKKYALIDTEEELPPFIDPRSKMSFAPSFGNLILRNSDVQMIVCSFDAGRVKLILFPWSKKEAVSKLVNPPAPALPVQVEKKRPARKEQRAEPYTPSPGPRKKSPKRDFWDWSASEKNKNRVTPAELRRAPVMPTAVEQAAPAAPGGRAPGADVTFETQEKLDRAIQNFVYTPSGAGSSSATPAGAVLRSEAHVIDYNRPYNFVTLNLGEEDGLKKDTILSIVRGGKLMAKARVQQVRASVSAAAILPESLRGEIRAGDGVAFV